MGWERYQVLFKEQQLLSKGDYGGKRLLDIMARLPNLKTVIVSNSKSLDLEKPCLENISGDICISDRLLYFAGKESHEVPVMLTHIIPLMRAIDRTGIALEELVVGLVHWRFFHTEEGYLKVMKRVVRSLESFKLFLMTFEDPVDDDWSDDSSDGFSDSDRKEYLELIKEGAARSLLQAMPKLRILDFCLSSRRTSTRGDPEEEKVDLESVIGDLTWAYLHELCLSALSTTEEDLFNLLMRHGSTLKLIFLSDITLNNGSWASLFVRVRESSLSLETFSVMGHLRNRNTKSVDNWNCTTKFTEFQKQIGMVPPKVQVEAFVLKRNDQEPICTHDTLYNLV
ncbi:MAG: hypothetical protein Q9166_003768 [cf. Caloplaca sp. 2 TL-2023]